MKITSKKILFNNYKNLTLFGKYYYPKDCKPVASVFIVPGISSLGTFRYKELQRYLSRNKILSFSYDFSGVGMSNGKLEDTYLPDLISDTQFGFDLFIKDNSRFKPIIVIGYSLGGYITLRMLFKLIDISGLILISPPIFSEEADRVPLDNINRERIKAHYQDSNSKLFKDLNTYPIKTLILFGDEDTKVKANIRKRYDNIDNKEIINKLLISGSHALLNNITEKEKGVEKELFKNIISFVNNL